MYHRWCEPFGGLVQEQEFRVAHECPGNGQHLLFTSAEAATLAGLYILQGREKSIDPLHVPSLGFPDLPRGYLQIFSHREVGKDSSIVRDIAYTLPSQQVGLFPGNLLLLEPDASSLRRR